MTTMNATSSYATINGMEMYYEIHGSGFPLVLLHGAYSEIETSFGKMLPALAEKHRVIAVEMQGHGHTADIDREMTYPALADDIVALLRELNIEQADIFGYSMGAGVAIDIAIRHPGVVRKLVLLSMTTNRDGAHPGLFDSIDQITPEMFEGTMWKEAYDRKAPHPEQFPELSRKLSKLDHDFVGWSDDQVKGIAAPALVIIGDSDIVRPEHAVEIFRLLGGGVMGDMVPMAPSQLAIIPATTHVSIVDRADWITPMVTEFLAK